MPVRQRFPFQPPKPPKPRERLHTVWDGKAFLQVSPEEAKRMVEDDLGQDLTSRIESATSLRRRHEFTGYAKQKPKLPEPKAAEELMVVPRAAAAPMKSWLSYRGIVATDIGKPANRVTKADVEDWWQKNQPDS